MSLIPAIPKYSDIKSSMDILSKPWCIVGTGKNVTNLSDFNKFNLWVINHAIHYTLQAEVWSLLDDLAIQECNPLLYEYDHMITRTRNIEMVKDFHRVYGIEFQQDIDQTGIRLYPDQPHGALTNSSAMAVNILGKWGVKRIYMAGHGGTGKHEMFDGFTSCRASIDQALTYDKHYKGCEYWADHWKVELLHL